MKERIEKLLNSYWAGESTLQEEAELRELLKKSDGFESEKAWFAELEDFSKEEPHNLQKPRRTQLANLSWMGWAASILILIGTYFGWQAYERQQEEQAYHEVMAALSLFQEKYSEGQQQLQKMNDLKYLNTTNELFKPLEK
ncbi:hypothetical protein KUV23_08950 [Algoriphagus marincola]|uniref:Anti-sigma factor n=1 Tax=Algoriphagus marincola TaxID=264027 RepID=A0ABS7N559_9BACT|nr:hypothetical protein [Algoriphagus marincola]MBY5951096.1 hypothetical protein [Algoriphagus marincola]